MSSPERKRKPIVNEIAIYGLLFIALFLVVEPILRESAQANETTPSTPTLTLQQRLEYGEKLLPPYYPDSVKFWGFELSEEWGPENDIDPNWLAAIMTNETCGDDRAVNVNSPSSKDYPPFGINSIHLKGVPESKRMDPNLNARLSSEILKKEFETASGNHHLTALSYVMGHTGARSGRIIPAVEAYARRYVDFVRGKISPNTQHWLKLVNAPGGFCDRAWNALQKRYPLGR